MRRDALLFFYSAKPRRVSVRSFSLLFFARSLFNLRPLRLLRRPVSLSRAPPLASLHSGSAARGARSPSVRPTCLLPQITGNATEPSTATPSPLSAGASSSVAGLASRLFLYPTLFPWLPPRCCPRWEPRLYYTSTTLLRASVLRCTVIVNF